MSGEECRQIAWSLQSYTLVHLWPVIGREGFISESEIFYLGKSVVTPTACVLFPPSYEGTVRLKDGSQSLSFVLMDDHVDTAVDGPLLDEDYGRRHADYA